MILNEFYWKYYHFLGTDSAIVVCWETIIQEMFNFIYKRINKKISHEHAPILWISFMRAIMGSVI